MNRRYKIEERHSHDFIDTKTGKGFTYTDAIRLLNEKEEQIENQYELITNLEVKITNPVGRFYIDDEHIKDRYNEMNPVWFGTIGDAIKHMEFLNKYIRWKNMVLNPDIGCEARTEKELMNDIYKVLVDFFVLDLDIKEIPEKYFKENRHGILWKTPDGIKQYYIDKQEKRLKNFRDIVLETFVDGESRRYTSIKSLFGRKDMD